MWICRGVVHVKGEPEHVLMSHFGYLDSGLRYSSIPAFRLGSRSLKQWLASRSQVRAIPRHIDPTGKSLVPIFGSHVKL